MGTTCPSQCGACLVWKIVQRRLGYLSLDTVGVRASLDERACGDPPHLSCGNARSLLAALIAHPDHRYIPDAPPLSAAPFDALVSLIRGYRQMADATLLHVARAHGFKLVTFDQSVPAISPWPDAVEVLIP